MMLDDVGRCWIVGLLDEVFHLGKAKKYLFFFCMMRIDEHGFEYYDQLPADFRLACMDDFEKGFLSRGKTILALTSDDQRFEIYRVNNPLSEDLRLFISLGRLYVHDPVL